MNKSFFSAFFYRLPIALVIFCFFYAANASGKTKKNSSGWGIDVPFKPFYVYKDAGSPYNHFYPTGWMGDYACLTMVEDCIRVARIQDTCIKIVYNPNKGNCSSGWAGIFWQNPRNNWGDEEGAFDLTGARRLSFMAKGLKGNEVVSKFQAGGIYGNFPDSDFKAIYNVRLTKKWKKYYIDLTKTDLSYISGGFCVILTKRDNLKGATIFLDEIRYE